MVGFHGHTQTNVNCRLTQNPFVACILCGGSFITAVAWREI